MKTRSDGDNAFLHYESWAVAFPSEDAKPVVTPVKPPVSGTPITRLLRRLRKR